MNNKNGKGWKVVTYKDLEDAEDHSSVSSNKQADADDQPEVQSPKESVSEESVSEPKIRQKSRPLIWGDLSAKPYWKRNLFPVLLEGLLLILFFNLPINQLIYVQFFFYLVLFVFYLVTKSFTFRKLWRNLTSGIYFWKATIVSTIFFGVFFYITVFLQKLFPSLDMGFYPLEITNNLSLFIFAVTSLFLAPIVEETFYRGNLISLESKRLMAITFFVSILLFAITHSYKGWGILSAAFWALPLTVTFIKTRNFYVTITAHLFVNLIINLPTIIMHFL